MKDIQKEYYGNRVLKGVNLNIKPGEIHAVVGENGAGKSTLMNILFGMRVIHDTGGFEGEVVIDGETVVAKSSEEVMQLGVGMVHQEFMLIPDFTIAENIKLNREITTENIVSKTFKRENLEFLDRKQMNAEAKVALDTLGMDIKETTKVAMLPIGHMQFIEIAREIDKSGIKLLVFDEPTAVLTESEADNLLKAMKNLADKGIGILFITHRLDEVKAVTDNITIIRDGEHIKTVPTSEVSVEEIAGLMVGRQISISQNEDMMSEAEIDALETILEVRDLKVNMPGEEVKGIDLDIKRGEILGIAGLAGHGKIGVANGIMGLYKASGQVKYNGQPLDISNTKVTLSNDIAFVSEDRKGVGLLLDGSIEDNIMITSMQVKRQFLSGGLINKALVRKHANQMIEQLDIRCTGSKQPTRRLSGGNQQKVCLARALTQSPKLLFVSEPTRGIDIGAKKLVLDYLTKLAKEDNVTVVVTSSELAELRSVCDRIAIVAEGRLEGILMPSAEDVEFGLMMSGEYHKYMKKEAN
jgi:simple sugar transport system ATP-binding protein